MNFDEALSKVQHDLGQHYIVVRIDTRPYGWMFHYVPRTYIETGDRGQCMLGGGPIFVDKFGETYNVPGLPSSALDRFYRNWEVSHPEYEWPKFESEFSDFGEPTILGEDEEHVATRLVNTILTYSLKDQATEIRIESLSNLFSYRLIYCIDGKWQLQWKAPYYALVALCLKQMADIPPRNQNHLNETQSGTFRVTTYGENYFFHVTATIVGGCEQLSWRIRLKLRGA